MKIKEVQILDKAQDDIEEILYYIKYKLEEPEISEKYKKLFKSAILSLMENAYFYRIVKFKSIHDYEIREMDVKNFMVFYTINLDIVQVIAVLYRKSNWSRKLKGR